MNIVQIEENVKQLIHRISKGELHQKEFIYELLLAYGLRKYSINKLRSGDTNLAEDKENTLFWKLKVYFKISKQHDLHGLIDQMKSEKRTESNKIRFLIVTDFKNLLAIDTKTQDTLDVPFSDLAKKFDFFLPWAGMEKAVYQGENPADVKAAEKLAKLFDEIKADNFDENDLNNKDNLHQLNIFLSRLLFCYFAEDTEIFKDKQFTSAISKSNEDGSDLSALIGRLFKVLNQSAEDREADLPDYLADFPYVNGGLFKDDIQVPKFTRKSRRILIECGAELDWSDINPDIFGSMFQAVVHTEQRSNMGQHYTSVPNIMKVIEPLFLNDLYEELEKNQNSINKLLQLQQRLGQLKIFDPACGSGNFLIIAYKELRKFEMELLKRIQELELDKTGQLSKPFSVIQVSQFYGIEIDDFAHEIAILSLWLTEHQMNLSFKDEFGELIPTLPLKNSGYIMNGNSLQMDWNEVCPKDTERFILGNPPYYGAKKQNKDQKNDMALVFKGSKTYKNLDYISCWVKKGAEIIDVNTKVAFVTTNSLVQGDQVDLLWSHLPTNNIEIGFAHQTFKWGNSAKKNAGVSCVIIGLRSKSENKRLIFTDLVVKSVKNISPYLTDNNDLIVKKRKESISNLPRMVYGNMPLEGNYLKLDADEKLKIETEYPEASYLIRPLIGGNEHLYNEKRWCLWIDNCDLDFAMSIEPIKNRIEQVRLFRETGGEVAQTLVSRSHQFRYRHEAKNSLLLIPCTSSERRDYLPIGIYDSNYITLNSAQIIYDPPIELLSILSSKMHMLWTKAVAGALESRIRYSNILCYNTFPFPKINENQKLLLINQSIAILQEREKYSDKNIADIYDPEKMPLSLKNVHKENDLLIESIYRKSIFQDDNERLDYLFKKYEKMVGDN
ncbi:DNA methyltransferase [Acinetobacter radioresistens]|uniref:DNA methyltransferase n=1 Tax=Acinetobacter radioresistens TaxID=40216 RepID=UPI0032659931